jgi:hypothetical protein
MTKLPVSHIAAGDTAVAESAWNPETHLKNRSTIDAADHCLRKGMPRVLKFLRFFVDWAAKKWPLRGSLKLG